ncbi:hypothetical protein GCM10010123_44870 [Pilimelia anulata]|uniref:Secreted protein n=1 Tax=Pilimelia anulata TaxID=53371 RepID=A0A8J3BI13_9ACTN|nr:hypothetical protein [Pilimelia anulata]GGK09989.1 hypothetical protein GCM10010123_44870 [Pilimelia anulata]
MYTSVLAAVGAVALATTVGAAPAAAAPQRVALTAPQYADACNLDVHRFCGYPYPDFRGRPIVLPNHAATMDLKGIQFFGSLRFKRGFGFARSRINGHIVALCLRVRNPQATFELPRTGLAVSTVSDGSLTGHEDRYDGWRVRVDCARDLGRDEAAVDVYPRGGEPEGDAQRLLADLHAATDEGTPR